MRVGLDIDGVCADFSTAANHWIAEHLGVEPLDVDRWDWYVQYGDGHEIAWRQLWADILKPESTFWHDLAPCEGAVRGVDALLDAGHDIEFITARPGKVRVQTGDWLDATFGKGARNSLVMEKDKATRNRDIYLDDAPEHLEALAKAGMRVVCMARPWNKEWRRTLPTPVATVTSVLEFSQCIDIGQWTYGA